MAVTYTVAEISPNERVGRKLRVYKRLTLSGTYDANGFTVTPASIGLVVIDHIVPGTAGTGTTALNTQWDQVNKKIKLFETAGTVDLPHKELTAAASVANYTVDIEGVGY